MPQRFVPRLRATLPDGWFAKESMTLLAPDGQANLIASSEPLDPSITAEQYAQVQGDLLAKEFPGYRQLRYQRALVFGGRPGYERAFQWTPPDGAPVIQVQLYFAASGRGYTATATTPAAQYPRFEGAFRKALDELSIE